MVTMLKILVAIIGIGTIGMLTETYMTEGIESLFQEIERSGEAIVPFIVLLILINVLERRKKNKRQTEGR